MSDRPSDRSSWPRCWIGNFDFEHELASTGHTSKQSLRQRNSELSWHLTGLAESRDVVFLPQLPSDAFLAAWAEKFGGCQVCQDEAPVPRHLAWTFRPRSYSEEAHGLEAQAACGDFVATPWGWSLTARRRAERFGFVIDAPPVEVVRDCNSRRVSMELESRFGWQLEGSFRVTNLPDLEDELQRHFAGTQRWVVKAEFGMSARERVLGQGAEFSQITRNWIAKRLSRGEWLVFEPWLDRVAEAGILWDVPDCRVDADVKLVALTELLVDEHGQYCGSRVLSDVDSHQAGVGATKFGNWGAKCTNWKPAVEATRSMAQALRDRGYFGPLGIDAMCYREAGSDGKHHLKLRFIQDINARWTMGFVAAAYARRLGQQTQQDAVWRLVPTVQICERLGIPANAQAAQEVEGRLDLPVSQTRGLEAHVTGTSQDTTVIRTSPLTLAGKLTRQVGMLCFGR